MNKLAKHSEILFIWDAKMCNPNGDMSADNAPRFDEIDEKAIISDVRVKRTIRDDLQYRKNQLIFINNKEIIESGLNAEGRFDQIKKAIEDDSDELSIFLSCIDNRLFGGVAPKSGIQLVGAVQFTWTKSMNRTETVLKSGTGAFATKSKEKGEKKHTKTFRVDNYIPYGIFPLYGTINSLQAKKSSATEEDIALMLNSLWMGTKLLNTRSKEGQKPRLLMRIIYKENSHYFTGLLDEMIKLDNEDSNMLRSINDANINFDELITSLNSAEKVVEKIEVVLDGTMEKYRRILTKLPSVDLIDEMEFLSKD